MAERPTCSVEGCDRPHEARGGCTMHYQRLKKFGSMDLPTAVDRFWRKVDKTDTCWIYTGALSAPGYGMFFYRPHGHSMLAHRFAYEITYGELPSGEVDHRCHNRACVRPDHLQVVDHKQNCENLTGLRRNSTTGVRGVTWDASRVKYQVKVTHHYRTYHGGRFDTLEEAEAAAVELRLRLHTNNLLDRADADHLLAV